MLQLRTECAKPLEKLIIAKKDEIVTCIFDTNIQFEQLDEEQLLPKDVMRIVYEYFDDKVIVDCSIHKDFIRGDFVLFNINDNDNKITYYYYFRANILCVTREYFNQKDDSIMIIFASMEHFNLSRLYYHYTQNNDLTFETIGYKSKVTVDNNKYTIKLRHITYKSLVLNHEILQRRIAVMKQLIDIIKKLKN